jgi:hypothetical protein
VAISFFPSHANHSSVTISNTCPKYAPQTFSLERSKHAWEIAGELGSDWISYVKASIAEVIARNSAQPVSMYWLVDGVIPEGAGLSVSNIIKPDTNGSELCGFHSGSRSLDAGCQWDDRHKGSERHCWTCFKLRASSRTT